MSMHVVEEALEQSAAVVRAKEVRKRLGPVGDTTLFSRLGLQQTVRGMSPQERAWLRDAIHELRVALASDEDA